MSTFMKLNLQQWERKFVFICMIGVLVGDQDGVEIARIHAPQRHASLEIASSEAAIDHHARRAAAHQQGISGAAAAE